MSSYKFTDEEAQGKIGKEVVARVKIRNSKSALIVLGGTQGKVIGTVKERGYSDVVVRWEKATYHKFEGFSEALWTMDKSKYESFVEETP